MEALTTEEINTRLQSLDTAWALVGGTALERVYEFANFKDSLRFVNEIGRIAEEHQHHPDIQLSWGKVIVTLTTHDANGLSVKDFELASALDALSV